MEQGKRANGTCFRLHGSAPPNGKGQSTPQPAPSARNSRNVRAVLRAGPGPLQERHVFQCHEHGTA
nr:MAG TPA: hypothetical protein [Caudoviricetes sp.]